MKSFSITTLTGAGELALNNQNFKRNSLSFLEKKILKKAFIIEHLQNPSGIKFSIRPGVSRLFKKIDVMALISKIKEGMQEEAAYITIDYNILTEG